MGSLCPKQIRMQRKHDQIKKLRDDGEVLQAKFVELWAHNLQKCEDPPESKGSVLQCAYWYAECAARCG